MNTRALNEYVTNVVADAWPRAGGTPMAAVVRVAPEDFCVDEYRADSAAPAQGEYLHVRIRKRNLTTAWVVGALARHYAVPHRDVGYAGLKDRRALTSQWFSVRTQLPPLQPWFEPGTAVLDARWARSALRPGDLDGNRFRIRIASIQEREPLEAALVRLRADPYVPNYFGPQRFGNSAGNLQAVWAWSAGGRPPEQRFTRGLWLSAARSLLFNLALAERVRMGDWRVLLPGEARIHGLPAGPLWGRGRTLTQRVALARCLEAWRDAVPARALIEREGLRQDLRPWALAVTDLEWEWQSPSLVELCFTLPPGGYATTVLRELIAAPALLADLEESGADACDGAHAKR